MSRVQVSGVLEVHNTIDENCEIDESYQKAPEALFFIPVTGEVNKVQFRGKLEVQSEIFIDESCPETAKILLNMPARGQLNKVVYLADSKSLKKRKHNMKFMSYCKGKRHYDMRIPSKNIIRFNTQALSCFSVIGYII